MDQSTEMVYLFETYQKLLFMWQVKHCEVSDWSQEKYEKNKIFHET